MLKIHFYPFPSNKNKLLYKDLRASIKKYMPFSLMIALNLSNGPEYPDKRGLCAGSEGVEKGDTKI